MPTRSNRDHSLAFAWLPPSFREPSDFQSHKVIERSPVKRILAEESQHPPRTSCFYLLQMLRLPRTMIVIRWCHRSLERTGYGDRPLRMWQTNRLAEAGQEHDNAVLGYKRAQGHRKTARLEGPLLPYGDHDVRRLRIHSRVDHPRALSSGGGSLRG